MELGRRGAVSTYWIGGRGGRVGAKGGTARTASKSQILIGLPAASVEYAFADRAAALLSRGDGDAED